MTYPNQPTIQNKKPLRYPEKLFTQMGKDEVHTAVVDLSPSALDLWLYLMLDSPNYEHNYSKKAFMNWANVSEATARKAMYELRDKHYIHRRSDTYWFFTPTPYEDDIPQWAPGL